jgi:predicted nucleic acid-binding protein
VFILDTNTVRAIVLNPTLYLQHRVTSVPNAHIYISDIVVHEMIAGVFGPLQEHDKLPTVTKYYPYLRRTLADINRFQILPYDDAAEAIFRKFKPAPTKLQRKDFRIAASAILHRFTVITRNVKHFKPTGAKFENWIDPPLNWTAPSRL